MFSGSDSAKNHFKCSVDQMSGKPLYGDKKIIIRRMRVRRFGLGRLELADFSIVESIVERKGEGRLLSPFLCLTLQLSKPIDNHISFDYNVLIR